MVEHGQQHDEKFPQLSLHLVTLECLREALAELRQALPMAGIFPSRADEARRKIETFYRLAEAHGLIEPHEAETFRPLLRLN
ncbi:hypothetical protein [Paracoccus aeridis]|uniref:hypothetical protein n=1 Tax=Paracoccus aeridis TaxID=1966466 RepID=UPI0010AA5D96|nr:hypothetical protein [Paracoccus aeridis]